MKDRQIPPLKFIVEHYKKGPALLDKYGGDCPVGAELERAKCVIENVYRERQIGLYSQDQRQRIEKRAQ